MINKILYAESGSTDPYNNIALEECLLDAASPGALIFFLWQNENTVVIGRNQNCRRECDIKKLEADGGRLARRLSGGGAVYHDLGNLNFSFMAAKNDYDENTQTDVVLSAVRRLGILAEKTGRNDLTADGRKFSGNAFYHGANILRHGTVLVSSDLNKLGEYLNAPGGKLETKGVRSVSSRVVNLSELDNAIGISETKTALKQAIADVYGAPASPFDMNEIDKALLDSRYEKFSSAGWKYGPEIGQGRRVCERFKWGEMELILTIKDGCITGCSAFSDALDTAPAELLPSAFIGIKYARDELSRAVESVLPPYGEMCGDIKNLILSSLL